MSYTCYKMCCKEFEKHYRDPKMPVKFRLHDGEGDYSGDIFVLKWFVDDHPDYDRDYYPCYVRMWFCPWCGKELEQSFVNVLRDKLLSLEIEEANCADFGINTKIPQEYEYLKNRDWYDKELEVDREQHKKSGACESLKFVLEGGEDNPVIYVPRIRTYGILRERLFKDGYWLDGPKDEYCDFVPINYCDSCGAKFPERLDEKLTEILQKEYGLESWKDYKKAPAEFQTDKWWRKRGL